MSIEAEQAVVVAAMSSAEQYDTVSQALSSADFTDELSRVVWDSISALREAGRDVDIVTLSAFLDGSYRWQSLQLGPSVNYISALVEAGRSFEAALVYADIIRQAAIKRRLVAYAEAIKELAHAPDMSADDKLSEVHTMLAPLTEGVPDGFVSYKEAAVEAVDSILAIVDSGGGLSGLSSGYGALDSLTAGFQESDLIYVGARPSMGKTVLGMNIANHVAKTGSVLVFSLEMPKKALAKRTIASLAPLDMNDLMRGNIDEQKTALLTSAGLQIAKLDLRIDDTAGLHVDQMRTRARIAARKKNPSLILIDYLTLIRGKGDSKHLEVSYISKSLKAMAKELSCPVVCLAQLNRGLENRPDKRPKLSDLRESGSIEEDADVVMFLYRDEVYDSESQRKGILEVNVAKNRNGEIGTCFLTSELNHQRFVSLKTAVPPMAVKTNTSPLASVMGKAAHGEGF